VDVRNGSTTQGLAKPVLKTLTDKGYQGGDVGDAESVRSSSLIQYAPGERSVAEYTGGELGGQFTYEENGSLSANHLTVVVGTDYGQSGTGAAADTPAPTTPVTKPTPQINADGLNCVN
jgi:hypothetical protein